MGCVMEIWKVIVNKFKSLFLISRNRSDFDFKLVSNVETIRENNKSFLDIDYGTIIWAKRYNNEVEKEKIPEGHRCGPFIVVGRDKENLLCFYATGRVPEEVFFKQDTILLDASMYGDFLDKNTYIRTNKIISISENQLVEVIDSLTLIDRKKLNKKISVGLRKCLYFETGLENTDVHFETTDIINLKGRFYLIVNCKEKKFDCLPLSTQNGNYVFSVDGVDYYYDIDNFITFDNLDSAYLVNFVTDLKTMNIIKVRRKNYLEKLDKYRNVKIGCIIKNIEDEKIYYVYGEEGDKWLIVKVDSLCNEQMASFKIEENEFYSDFRSNCMISKKDTNYVVLFVANAKETEEFRKIKKAYLKSHTTREGKKQRKYKFDSGVIVKTKFFDEKEYVIIIGNQDDVVVVLKDQINEDFCLEVLPVNSIYKSGKMNDMQFRDLLMKIKEGYKGLISRERMNLLKKKYDL